MWRFVPAVVVPLALVLSGCGGDGAGARGANSAAEEPQPVITEPDGRQLYEANGMVCEKGTRGPRLWLGGMRLVLGPPACDGIPLASWDWHAVEGEESEDETTWGSYHVVGSYDGESLAVTDVGPYEDDPSAFGTNPDTRSPCDEPDGGWVAAEPAHNTQNDVGRAAAYAESQPDYVVSWVTHLEPARLEFGPVIFNAVFSGDAGRHEAEIRNVWDGPLCVVVRGVPTARELDRIRKEVEAGLGDLGLQMLWSADPAVEPVIEIGVVADVGGKGQSALDTRYGPGVVRLIPALKPVS